MPFTCKPTQHTFIGSQFSMIYRPLVILALLLTLFITTPVFSANFQQGLDAYDKGNYTTALEQWSLLAEQGNASAQYNLGIMYLKGQGVPQDYKTAAKWYRLAAEQGESLAQANLASMYEQGTGVLQDYKMAVKWYTLAAEQGHVESQSHLAGLYYSNSLFLTKRVVPPDDVRAYMWYSIAALNGEGTFYRDQLAKHLTPYQLEEAKRLAREWVAKHDN